MKLVGCELVFLVADHHHATCRLVNNRCTFRCVTQCITLVVAFESGLACKRLALILWLLSVAILHKDKRDILLRATS